MHCRAPVLLFLIVFSVHILPKTAFAETFVLSSGNTGLYRIVSSESASSSERFAANELKKYLEQISSAGFKQSNRLSEYSIVVGSSASIQNIFSVNSLPPMKGEEYGIFKRNKSLFLMGGSDKTVLYAVYDFLSQLGCRWIAPDFDFYEGRSHFIPAQTALKYTCSDDRIEKPVFKYRKFYIEEGLTHNTENLKQLIYWMPKARFNVLVAPLNYEGKGRSQWNNWREQLTPELVKRGITIEVGGHGYQNFLNAEMENGQLFKKHPDWFGIDKNGQRSANPHVVFCSSNSDAVAYLQNNVLAYLIEHPEINIFDFWPPDNETWCECESCRAMGSATDRHALLVSQTARFLHDKIPAVKLECLAYSRYVEPPQNEVLDSNVLLDFCPINQSFEYQIYEDSFVNNKFYRENLLSWLSLFKGEINIYSYYRKYAWRSLPVILPHYMQNDLRFYRNNGISGISVYSEPGDWFTYGLNHFVFSNLAWNPDADVDKLIGEYCTKLYGTAAKTAISVYSELEDIVRFACRVPYTKPKSTEQYDEYITRLKSCSNKIKAAIDQYPSDATLYRLLHRLGLTVEYATQSAIYMKFTSEENEEKVTQVANNIKRLISENIAAGVFIPR